MTALHRGRRSLPPAMAFLGDPQSAAPDHRRRPHRQTSLRRHSTLFHSKIANGLIEGINSLVQAAKAKARGYRSIRNLTAIVYLVAGKLDLSSPS